MTEEETKQAWLDAAVRGDNEALKELFKPDVDINTADEKKNTALHHAARQAHLGMMHFLIENGANLNALNDRSSRV